MTIWKSSSAAALRRMTHPTALRSLTHPDSLRAYLDQPADVRRRDDARAELARMVGSLSARKAARLTRLLDSLTMACRSELYTTRGMVQ